MFLSSSYLIGNSGDNNVLLISFKIAKFSLECIQNHLIFFNHDRCEIVGFEIIWHWKNRAQCFICLYLPTPSSSVRTRGQKLWKTFAPVYFKINKSFWKGLIVPSWPRLRPRLCRLTAFPPKPATLADIVQVSDVFLRLLPVSASSSSSSSGQSTSSSTCCTVTVAILWRRTCLKCWCCKDRKRKQTRDIWPAFHRFPDTIGL